MLLSNKKFFYFSFGLLLVGIVFIGRLSYLQIIKNNYYLTRSEGNFIQENILDHSRGQIFDQSGVVLVNNKPSFDLYVILSLFPNTQVLLNEIATIAELDDDEIFFLREKMFFEKNEFIINKEEMSSRVCSNFDRWIRYRKINGINLHNCKIHIDPNNFPFWESAILELSKILKLSTEDVIQLWNNVNSNSEGFEKYKPTLFIRDLNVDVYRNLEVKISAGNFPGLSLHNSIKRRYNHGSLAAHIIGYTAEDDKYKPKNKRIGKSGLELVYENVLGGKDGHERIIVDSKGRRFSEKMEKYWLGEKHKEKPCSGDNLVLSIDLEVQKIAENSFRGSAGSVIVMEVGTGFILSMASFPSYDPNDFTANNASEIIKTLSEDPLKPWINRAIQEHYAPGSTFKAITAFAGLEHGVLKMNDYKFCRGKFTLGGNEWRCYKRDGHGSINLVQALKASCDVFFYKLGYELGLGKLAETAKLLGFGRKTGIDLDTEIPGIIPNKKYYKDRFGYFVSGFTINSSIGQGDVTVTPLQLAVAYDALINGGKIYKPQLVREIRDKNNYLISKNQPILLDSLEKSIKNLNFIKNGLSHVTEKGGTAEGLLRRPDLSKLSKWIKLSKVKIGGKTGTAQVVQLSKLIDHLEPHEVDYQYRDHAWFVGFAPIKKPEIIVVAMTEHGGFGGTVSAPVVADIIKIYYEKVRGRGRYASFK